MGMAQLGTSKEDKGNAVLAVNMTAKGVVPIYITITHNRVP